MSKDMLGPITRALVGIPESRLGVVADIANRLNGEQGDAWHTRFKALLREGLQQGQSAPIPQDFIAEVDFGQTLSQMIKAAAFDWTNSDITEKRFPVVGDGKKKYRFKLYEPKRLISSEDVVAMMAADGFPAARHEAGLAFARDFPGEQLKRPIALLGSSAKVSGFRYVSYLDRNGAKRFLSLYYWAGGWRDFWAFLGAQEVSGA
jgi:hypothetical protein